MEPPVDSVREQARSYEELFLMMLLRWEIALSPALSLKGEGADCAG
jgi:hypothetical protein